MFVLGDQQSKTVDSQELTESSTLYVDRTSISGITVSSSDVVLSSTMTTFDAIMLLLWLTGGSLRSNDKNEIWYWNRS